MKSMRFCTLVFVVFILGLTKGESGQNPSNLNIDSFKSAILANDLPLISFYFDNGYLEKTIEGKSTLSYVVYNGSPEALKLFLGRKKFIKENAHETLMYHLIKMGKEDTALIVLEYIDDPNFVLFEEFNLTLLHEASREGMITVSKQLIEKGASTEKTTIMNNLPITLALNNGEENVYLMLLDFTNLYEVNELALESFFRSLIRADESLALLERSMEHVNFPKNIATKNILKRIRQDLNNDLLNKIINEKFNQK